MFTKNKKIGVWYKCDSGAYENIIKSENSENIAFYSSVSVICSNSEKKDYQKH